MQSIDDLIRDYLAALRILDLEGMSVLGADVTVAYRRLLLDRIAAFDRLSGNPAPETSEIKDHRYNPSK